MYTNRCKDDDSERQKERERERERGGTEII